MFARDHKDLHRLRQSVTTIRRLSDAVVKLGPLKVGMDGVLAAVPWAGLAYSLGAGGLLLLHGVRARASPAVVARMAAYLAADSLINVPIPFAPALIDIFFTGHTWAADALLKHMDETIYYDGSRDEAETDADFREHLKKLAAERKAGGKPAKRRIVYLKR